MQQIAHNAFRKDAGLLIKLWDDIVVQLPPNTRTLVREPKYPENDPVLMCTSCWVKEPVERLAVCQHCLYAA